MVACYFNGASWRRRSGPDQPFDSTPEEALKNAKLPMPTDPYQGGSLEGFKRMDIRTRDCQTAQVSIGMVHAEARRM